MAGASAAYALSAQGSVLVLETEDVTGYHATGRSAALFTRNYGSDTVRAINAASVAFYDTPPAGFCDTPLLSPRGCLTVASAQTASELDAVLALSSSDAEIIEMTPEDACAMVPFLRHDQVGRAVFEAGVTDIDVATLHLSYLKGAKARGAVVLTRQPVKALTHEAGCWRVQTGSNSFQAKTVINAAGAWAGQVGQMAGAQPIGLVPKKRTAIIVNGPDGVNCGGMPAVDFAGSDAYMKPEAGKLMASPGDATPTDPHDAWADDMDIAVLADWVMQQTTLEITRIEHSWAGLRSFVADGAPVVGFDPVVPDFVWLAGQGGYGIMMAPALAALTADLCAGSKTPLTAQFAQALSPLRVMPPKETGV
jgi:D-arginine dehydrogenase